jgi:DNA-directed RNA polymerase subunit RPC12/RpoP
MKANKKGLYKFGQTHKKDDKVVILSEYYTNDRPSYICSFCNQTLIKLTDSGGQNSSYWCRNCSVEFDPESENLRKESKIMIPDRNIEPAISSVGTIPDVSIRHEPELKGAFKALKDKGLRFTHYEEHNPA